MESDKPKKSGFWIANLIISLFFVLSSCFVGIWTLSVAGLFPYFFIVLLVLFLMIPVLYRKNQKDGKYKIPLWTVRIAFVLISLLFVVLPYIGLKFKYNKFFYTPKKIIYTYGVYTLSSNIDEMLPKHLPLECREYKFITQLGSIAQDYHPSVYLMFYTNNDTLMQYEKKFKIIPDVNIASGECKEHEYYQFQNEVFFYPKNFPDHVFWRLDDIHREKFKNMENAKIYIAGDYYTHGCLLDYDSGLVVFWT